MKELRHILKTKAERFLIFLLCKQSQINLCVQVAVGTSHVEYCDSLGLKSSTGARSVSVLKGGE